MKQAPWFHSIRFKVILMMVLPIVSLFLIFIWNTHKILDRFILESTRSTLSNYSQTLNLALSIQMTSREAVANLEPFLQELIGAETGGITYLALADEQGTVIAKTRQSPDPLPVPESNMAEAVHRDVVHIEQPILLASSNVGSLHFGVSIATVKEAARKLFIENLLEGLATLGVILAILLGVAFAVMLGLSRRLSRLMRTSAAITSGHYDIAIWDHGRDEFQVLSSQMNIMAGSIRSRVRDLETRKSEIDQLNARLQKRNSEIEQVNHELVETLAHLKTTQNSLIQSEKLAGLGSIVAAVAHELNTPIGNAVTVASTFMAKTKAFGEEARTGLRRSVLEQFLGDSQDAGAILLRNLTNAADLISSFKHVAVDQTSSMRREFMLATVVEDVLATLRPTVKYRPLEVATEIDGGIAMDSYPGPLGQVITNLFNNAVLHAFDEDRPGRILLHARALDGDRVRIAFRDDGKGIPQNILPKLFDPFFTTKLGQGGSGLGLHIVYNIVTGVMQGEVKVTSKQGEGTEFTLLLPKKVKPVAANGGASPLASQG